MIQRKRILFALVVNFSTWCCAMNLNRILRASPIVAPVTRITSREVNHLRVPSAFLVCKRLATVKGSWLFVGLLTYIWFTPTDFKC